MQKLLIATGIYPPAIGGPAQYAKELAESFRRGGWEVAVRTYRLEHKLPSGLRHFFYFGKVLLAAGETDLIIALDTFSVGLPATLAARLLGKKIIIRTGGDFLWEGYVERTGDKVLLRQFYRDTVQNWTKKERAIFWLTRLTLKLANFIVFSTDWQRDLWQPVYKFDLNKTAIIENYYGPRERSLPPVGKTFIGFARPLVWKNLDTLAHAFLKAKMEAGDLMLDLESLPYEEAMAKIRHAYAVILVSLGDISPNLILDAIRFGKPFILTRETGLYEKLRGIGIFVDPLNEKEIKEKILELAEPQEYTRWRSRVEQFTFTHTWDEIRDEFIELTKKLS